LLKLAYAIPQLFGVEFQNPQRVPSTPNSLAVQQQHKHKWQSDQITKFVKENLTIAAKLLQMDYTVTAELTELISFVEAALSYKTGLVQLYINRSLQFKQLVRLAEKTDGNYVPGLVKLWIEQPNKFEQLTDLANLVNSVENADVSLEGLVQLCLDQPNEFEQLVSLAAKVGDDYVPKLMHLPLDQNGRDQLGNLLKFIEQNLEMFEKFLTLSEKINDERVRTFMLECTKQQELLGQVMNFVSEADDDIAPILMHWQSSV
jgi:hypothetical protein